jgi:hypothetical protein
MDLSINSKKEKVLAWVLVIVVILGIGFLANNYKSQIKKFFGLASVYTYDSAGDNALAHGWTISTSSFAWGESIGWVDFAPAQGTTLVADNALWGYAYGENIGWISLNCANADNSCTNSYKILNDGSGNLSGFAYGENVGWIDFGTSTIAGRPYGVNISSTTGAFSGYAYAENVGWINFSNGSVRTSWRPSVTRTCIGPDGADATTTLANGSDTTYYSSSTVPNGTLCVSAENSESRTCTDGTLSSGTFTHLSCTVLEPADCAGPDTLPIADGNSKTFYLTNSVRAPARCTSEVRTCENGTLSTSTENYIHATCTVLPKASGVSTQLGTSTITDNTGLIQVFSSTTPDSASSTVPGGKVLTPIHTVILPVITPEKVTYPNLPAFGDTSSGFSGRNSFSFVSSISSFLFGPLPDAVTSTLNKSPKLKNYLASFGFSKGQDLVSIIRNPISLPSSLRSSSLFTGLYTVSAKGVALTTYITVDSHYNLIELVRVRPSTSTIVSLNPVNKAEPITGVWNNKKIFFTLDKGQGIFDFVSTSTPGRYILTSPASLMPLAVDVIAPSTQSVTMVRPSTWWSIISGWFGR